MTPLEPERRWWQTAVVYQIYPSSFKDSNGDGIGDIPGIISKVDYLKDLGVNAVWLSPVCKSPQVDMGYDISDYREIHAPYGTVEDIEHLIAELKKRDIKLIMDLVVNHTSVEHPWFLESKSSLDNPKRNWYHWQKGQTGPNGEKLPPNNWESLFKGSGWEYDETTDEYYLHIFAAAQPDLNWENPEVRAAIEEDMHFWLQKGLGGYRMDAINLISKEPGYPDAEVKKDGYLQSFFHLTKNRDPVHKWLREIKKNVFDKYDDIVSIGECGGTEDVEETLKYIDPAREELDMIFQFELTEIDKGPMGTFSENPWTLLDLKRITEKWQTVLKPAWNTLHMENHDSGRSVDRYGRHPSPKFHADVSKLLSCYMMTLGGTIYLHQGQEIGSRNLNQEVELHHYQDIATHQEYASIKAARMKAIGREDVDMSDVMKGIALKARDHSRLPLSWDSSKNAGFTTGKPWMMVHSDYKELNVAAQESDPNSILSTWRAMIAFRKEHPEELVYGKFQLVDRENEKVFAYRRIAKSGSTILVVLNWCHEVTEWSTPGLESMKIIKTIGKVREDGKGGVQMDPYACVCWQV